MDREQSVALTAPALRLAHLLATRLCHDLSGPLGGLGAALGEMPDDPEAAVLAVDAARLLRQRIALLRTAWGEAPPPLAPDGLRDLAEGLANAPRLHLDLAGLSPDPPFQPDAARLVVNAMMLAAESLPLGGVLALEGSASAQIVVTIAGRRAAWPEGLGAMLASADEAWAALDAARGTAALRGLQGPFTALLAHQAGVTAGLLLAPAAEIAPPLLLDLSRLAAA